MTEGKMVGTNLNRTFKQIQAMPDRHAGKLFKEMIATDDVQALASRMRDNAANLAKAPVKLAA